MPIPHRVSRSPSPFFSCGCGYLLRCGPVPVNHPTVPATAAQGGAGRARPRRQTATVPLFRRRPRADAVCRPCLAPSRPSPNGCPRPSAFFFFFAAPAVSPFLAVCGARARDTATPQGRGSTSWPLAGASSLAAPSTRTFLAAHVYPLRRGAAAPRRHRRGRLVRVVRVPMGGGSSRPPLRLARVPPPVSCPPARPFRRRPPARLHVRPLARRCCAPPPLRADHHGCPFPFVAPSGSPPPRRH